MPGGFLKKLGTDSCGITGTLVAVAFVWAGSRGGGNTSDAAPASATMASRNEIQRFIRGSLRKMAIKPTLASRQTCVAPAIYTTRRPHSSAVFIHKRVRYNELQTNRGNAKPAKTAKEASLGILCVLCEL